MDKDDFRLYTAAIILMVACILMLLMFEGKIPFNRSNYTMLWVILIIAGVLTMIPRKKDLKQVA